MNSEQGFNDAAGEDDDEWGEWDGPSKSAAKREAHRLADIADDILKLSPEDRQLLELPDNLVEAVELAFRVKGRSGQKRQRRLVAKLLRSMDSEDSEDVGARLKKIQHRHDTNTVEFRRLESWRDRLVDNDKQALDEVIARFPDVDRQHINQLTRTAVREKKQEKPPAAARKLFKYLRELDEPGGG